MCIIIYSPDGTIPRKHLEESLISNPHGWGFMSAAKGKLYVHKGMDFTEFFETWRRRAPGPVVFHARITSHGETNLDNCHPFPIPLHGLHMCHNGIIRQHADDKSPISDTRHFIADILTGLPKGFLANPCIVAMIEDYIGWSKLAFMDRHGNVDILNDQLGRWHKGRWYSNNSYKPYVEPIVPKPFVGANTNGTYSLFNTVPARLMGVEVEQ